jgi:hypothetical protein
MKILTIKRLLAAFALVVATGALSGCYIAPGYSYVQGNGSAGDVYYGSASAGYYGYYPSYGYYPYDYGYGWGCCYGPAIVGGWWGGGYYGRGYYGRGYYRGGRGGWSGHAASHGYSGGGHSGGGYHH